MRIRPAVFGTNRPVHFVMTSSPDPPIGETDPYRYLNEDEAPGVWCNRTSQWFVKRTPKVNLHVCTYRYLWVKKANAPSNRAKHFGIISDRSSSDSA